jgi:hypothetical protein
MAASKKQLQDTLLGALKKEEAADTRKKVKAEDVTGVADYTRLEIDASGSKDPAGNDLPATAVVVPVSKNSGAAVGAPANLMGGVVHRELGEGNEVLHETVYVPPAATRTLVCVGPEEGYGVRDESMTIIRLEKLSQSSNRAHPFAPCEPAAIDLDLGLQCLRMMVHHGVLAADETERLVNRINVLLRAHPPIQLNLQVGK